MADSVEDNREQMNPCCALLKEKYAKLEGRRNYLREALKIYSEQIEKFQSENTNLKKVYDDEKVQAEKERKERMKELEARVSLENEIPVLKSEIALLKQKGSLEVQGTGEELLLKSRVSELEMQTNRLKELLEQEISRADLLNGLFEKEKLRTNFLTAETTAEKEKAAEAWKLLEAEKSKAAEAGKPHSHVSDLEIEMNRLRELLGKEKSRANLLEEEAVFEKNKAAEAWRIAEAEKNKADGTRMLHSRIFELEVEINRLSEQLEKEKSRSDLLDEAATEYEKASKVREIMETEKSNASEERLLGSHASEFEIEMTRLKELLVKEKLRTNLLKVVVAAEKDETTEAWKIMKAEIIGSEEERLLCTRISSDEIEIRRLKELYEKEKSRADVLKEQINRLNEFIEKEKSRADFLTEAAAAEKGKALQAWKLVETEKSKVSEEKRYGDFERQKAEEYRIQLESMKNDARDARLKFVSETHKLKEENKKLETAMHMAIKEKKEADSRRMKAEEQMKLVEANRKKAVERQKVAEQSLVYLSQKLAEAKQRIEELQKDGNEFMCSKKLSGSTTKNVKHVEADNIFAPLKELEGQEMVDGKMLAEVHHKKAMEEKNRADELFCQLELNKETIEKLQKQIHALETCRNVKVLENWTAERTILKKQLKLLKMQLKHSKEVEKFEKGCGFMLRQEVCHLKEDIAHFLHRLDGLGGYFSSYTEGIDGLIKGVRFGQIEASYLPKKLSNAKQIKISDSEIVKPIPTVIDPSDILKHIVECAASLLPASAVNNAKTIAGIDSRLGPPLGGSDKKLQGSTITSSLDSFSNRQLVGSQEKSAFSVSASAELWKGNTNVEPINSNLSGEAAGINFSEKDAVVAENNVRGSGCETVVGRMRCNNKKKILNDVESVELLNPGGKKLQDALHDLSDRQKVKSLKENQCMGSAEHCDSLDKRGKSQKKRGALHKKQEVVQHSCETSSQKKKVKLDVCGRKVADVRRKASKKKEKLDVCGSKEADAHRKASLPIDALTSNTSATDNKSCLDQPTGMVRYNESMLMGFAEIYGGNYLKLLELDNAIDEERYREAIERPLSPLPDIFFPAHGKFHTNGSKGFGFDGKFLSEKEKSGQFSSFDVINADVNSNNLKLTSPSTSENPALRESGLLHAGDARMAGVFKNPGNIVAAQSNKSLNLNEGIKFQCESKHESVYGYLPVSLVVYSGNLDTHSISKIFCATRACIAQCLLASGTEWVVQEVLLFLHGNDLLPKEKICVFFSLLLLQISPATLGISGNVLAIGSNPCVDSFASHMQLVMSEVKTRNMFVDFCNLDDMVALFVDFIVNRKLLVYDNSSKETVPQCDSSIGITLGGMGIVLFMENATCCQLVAGSTILASICAALGQIGLLCEISCNIFQLHGFDSSLMFAILHVFAHLGGSKYLDVKNNLFMTIMKSIITFFEKEKSLVGASLPSPSEVLLEFSCSKCPFLEGAIPTETVVFLLLEKLRSCVSGTNDLMELDNLSHNSKALQGSDIEDVLSGHYFGCDSSCCLSNYRIASIESDPISSTSLCHLSDVLSMMELIACKMAWHWTCEKIIPHLLGILESCTQETVAIAMVTLLGEIGRLGIDGSGYDDIEVQNLRCRLSAFLSCCITRRLNLPLQTATVNALHRILSFDFEALTIGDSVHVSESAPGKLVENWFSSLSIEQRLLALQLFQPAGA